MPVNRKAKSYKINTIVIFIKYYDVNCYNISRNLSIILATLCLPLLNMFSHCLNDQGVDPTPNLKI